VTKKSHPDEQASLLVAVINKCNILRANIDRRRELLEKVKK
jgi:hypothetical protein